MTVQPVAHTTSANTIHSLIHDLCMAAIAHGHAGGATMEPVGGTVRPSNHHSGSYSRTTTAETEGELAAALGAQAIALGERYGYKVTFQEKAPVHTPRTEFPAVTYHLEEHGTGRIIETHTVEQYDADGKPTPLPAVVREHLAKNVVLAEQERAKAAAEHRERAANMAAE